MVLGLECLNNLKDKVVDNSVLVTAYTDMQNAYDDTKESIYKVMDCINVMEHLVQIRSVIKVTKATESIQYLYGQNDITLSMEGLTETISKGWDAIVKWFMSLWTKIKNFFKRLFGLTDKTSKSVEEEAKTAKENIKKQPFKAIGDVSGDDSTTVAESFTNTNIQKIKSDFDQNICDKANIDMIQSLSDEEASEIKQHGSELASKLNDVMIGKGSTKKPVDEKFINDSTTMSKTLQEMCKHGENVVNSLRTIPDKLKARAEKNGNAEQLKVAQHTIKQASVVMGAISDCSNEAAKGTVLIKNRLEAFNKKFSKKTKLLGMKTNQDDIDNSLKEAINSQDINKAKSVLIGYLDDDARREPMLALKVADKTNRIFEDQGKKLYDEDDGRHTSIPKEEWSSTVIRTIKASLRLNFSREKIALALEIIRYLRNKGDEKFQIK